ncbi:hypothetical protein GCK32_019601 [Trichostrongylus colubriformis]|uniref:Uncharacterized protein n=1 Tax=Trichostrongylus colubriformis TaxID=6319 RepID=A0AAN8FFQ4_TRICO
MCFAFGFNTPCLASQVHIDLAQVAARRLSSSVAPLSSREDADPRPVTCFWNEDGRPDGPSSSETLTQSRIQPFVSDLA